VLEYFPDLDMTLVEAKPLTGRQHQIRVHLFHVKHPIVGDPIYGQREEDVVRFLDKEISDEERIEKSGARRLLLHANRLAFTLDGIRYDLVSKEDFIAEAMAAMK
jgi:23S rRNA pseudouridine1911/1915/1917 synthase